MIGTTIGKYRVVAQLGRGATGIVYRAVDESLQRDVAIKVLNPDLAETEIMQRFRAEALTLAKLNHPEIATIYELVRSQSDLLMVMEFVRGETLEQLSSRLGPLAPERAAYLVDRVLAALEHAHHVGIVHRDIKPANIMVTDVGGVKVMDFGIARVRGAERMTADGRLMGTPAYMAPEQVLGQEVDARADLYSVGVVFYRLLTGALPFTADTAIGMLHKQIADVPTRLHHHRDDLADWCETIVQRSLAKAPADRFQTAEAFREALRGVAAIESPSDLAKSFAVAANEGAQRPESTAVKTLVISRAEADPGTEVLSDDSIALPNGSRTVRPATIRLLGRAMSVFGDATVAWRKKYTGRTGLIVVALAGSVVLLAYFAEWAPSARSIRAVKPITSTKLPPLIFKAKALEGTGRRQREHDVRLVLADGHVTVTADDGRQRPLHSVLYERVISINYSSGQDPMWNSPKGPSRVTRARPDLLGKLGIVRQRHWISLQTATEGRFIVLRCAEDLVGPILRALEERTGRTRQRI